MSQKYLFVRCTSKDSLLDVVLRAESWFSVHLKFSRTSAGKSTFRMQNDTDSANEIYYFTKYKTEKVIGNYS